jgi:hypothetical protein
MRATRAWGILIVLQGLILAGQWLGAPSLQSAQAQPAFNPERDRTVMIEELKSANSKLDRLISLLEGGELQVRVTVPDDKK